MRIEYRIVSSITGGLDETYTDKDKFIERGNYISKHKSEFKKNSMLFFYKHTFNKEGKFTSDTLRVIDLRGGEL